MNDNIITKEFQGSKVRTLFIDNEPWFVAKDTLQILLDNKKPDVSNAVKDLDSDELGRFKIVSGWQSREMAFVSESGLYSLILRSRKPVAKPFQKWVTKEVLPSIRKTGSYSLTEQPEPKSRDNLISVSQSELDKELQTLDFLLNRVHFSEKEKISLSIRL